MGYTPHTWVEYTGTGAQKAGWLNNMETQYDEMVTYLSVTITHSERYYDEATCSKYFSAGTDGTGSGFIAESIDGQTGDQLIAQMIPTGVIAIWYGAFVDIPTGWHLCDGNAGTVNLVGKFPMAAGTTYAQGDSGGAATVNSTGTLTIADHTLTEAEMAAHLHTYNDEYETASYGNQRGAAAGYVNGAETSTSRVSGSAGSGGAHGHTGSTIGNGAADNNMPQYKAYAYIQKV